MLATQIHLAVSTPKATGSDCRPIARSPEGQGRLCSSGADQQARTCSNKDRSASACAGLFGPAAYAGPQPSSGRLFVRASAAGLGPMRTLNGLEVVDNGDAQAGDGVEDGQHHDIQAEGAKQGLWREGTLRRRGQAAWDTAVQTAALRQSRRVLQRSGNISGPSIQAVLLARSAPRCTQTAQRKHPCTVRRTWPAHQGSAM